MKKIQSIVLVLMLCSIAHAQDLSLNNTICSRYWGSIVGGIFYPGGAVNFTTLTASTDYGYAYIGMINPLDTLQYDKNGGTEYYTGLGKGFNLLENNDGSPMLKLDVGAMYDAVSQIEDFDDDVVSLTMRLDAPNKWVTPYSQVWRWIPSGEDSPDTGYFVRSGLMRSQPTGIMFNGENVPLNLELAFGYSGEGLFGRGEGIAYYRGILGTTLKVTENLSVSPFVVGQLKGDQDESAGKAFVTTDRVFWNLSANLKF